MKITLESTTKIVSLNGIPARVWEGKTASGVDVVAMITRIAVPDEGQDLSEVERELAACRAPSAAVEDFPLHMIL